MIYYIILHTILDSRTFYYALLYYTYYKDPARPTAGEEGGGADSSGPKP